MSVHLTTDRFSHNREIAPYPTWGCVAPTLSFRQTGLLMSEAARASIAKHEMDIAESYRLLISVRQPLLVEFLQYAIRWKNETLFQSSIPKISQHRDYQRIIGMGPAALPLILACLSREPDAWFEALTSITGEQPVRKDHAGDMAAMANDWLQWGRARGYDC